MNHFFRALKEDKEDIIEELTIALAIVVAAVAILIPIIIAVRASSGKTRVTERHLTAGISRELTEMQGMYSATNVTERDIEAVETYIKSVQLSQLKEGIKEQKSKEEEEKAKKEEKQAEEARLAREECLINYFGYVPSDAELEHFYQIVMDESGNTEPEEGIGAVADVVANRCRSSKFPNTIDGVIYQRNQFQPIGDGTFGRFQVTDLVREICSDHIESGPHYPSLLYFTAGQYNPSGTPAFVIGHHYFSY